MRPTCDDLLGLVLAYEVYVAISKRGRLLTTVCRSHRLAAIPVAAITLIHLIRKDTQCQPL